MIANSGIVPYVSYGLLAANVLVFLYQLFLDQQTSDVRSAIRFLSENDVFILQYGVVPCKFLGRCAPNSILATPTPVWTTLLSSMFMHGGLMHIAGNMLYIWIFADNVEAAFGHVKFFLFYVLCGLAAAFAQALVDTGSTIPMIGASGAISGVLGAYLLPITCSQPPWMNIADNDALEANRPGPSLFYPVSDFSEFTLRWGAVPELVTGQLDGQTATHDVIETNRAIGMTSLDVSISELYFNGMISREDIGLYHIAPSSRLAFIPTSKPLASSES